MFFVLVHHYCKPGMVDAAAARIDANGDRMAARPGFLFRHRILAKDDDHKVSTITAWTDEAAYQGWVDEKQGNPPEGPSPYLRAVNEQYYARHSHQPA